jgi:hypothetical protein
MVATEMQFLIDCFFPPAGSHFGEYYLATALWIAAIGAFLRYLGPKAERLSVWLEEDLQRRKAKGQARAEKTEGK